jgi:putative ABC transport system permease protein
MLLKKPGFTFVAVITLALGIGANTAIFSVVNAVLLRPLPYAGSERLIAVWGRDTKAQDDHTFLSFDDFNDYRQSSQSFDLLAGFTQRWSFTLTGAGDAERINGFFASASAFPLLGVQPALGRGFNADEDKPGGMPVALLSYGLWQRRFGGDANIVGRPVTLDGEKLTVIGVMGPGFRWLEEGDLWRPLAQNPVVLRGRAVRAAFYVGRLKPGVTREQAQAEMGTIAARLANQYPASNATIGVNLVPLHEEITGKVRPALWALLGAVGLVLLIACVNVANLLLARSRSRSRELAVRVALGATRRRLVTQLLTESLLLAMVAGAAGLLLAFWGVDLLVNLSPADLPRRSEIGLDRGVLFFTALLSALTGIIFGLAPAMQSSRADLTESLKEGSRGTGGAGRRRALSLLVVAEVALALVVVTASGLLLRSFVKLQGVAPGFNTENALSFDLPLPSRYQDANARLAFYQRFYSRIETLPGVVAVGDVTRLPLAGRAGNPTTMLAIEGAQVAPGERPQVDFRRAGRDYFRAMNIPLAAGRLFNERDTPATEPVAIINQIAAQRFFPGQDPVGKRVGFGNAPTMPQWSRIVGVVGDIRHVGLQVEPRPEVYIAASQAPPFAPVVVVRSSTDPAALVSAIRAALREIDPDAPVFNVLTLRQIRYQSLEQPRFQVFLFGLFGGVALLLAVIGVYGVMAYSVAQRTHEVGIRVALGARRKDVMRLVVGEGMKLAVAGIALGIPAALVATRLLERLLFGVKAADVATYAAVALLLAAAAFVACFVPARKAARVDPMIALRRE